MRKCCRTVLFILFFTIYHLSTAFGAEICVSTPVAFQNALNQAEQNEEDDLIKVQQGIYAGYELYYSFTKEHNITVRGGYTAFCATRERNPANTILDGSSVRRPLTLISYGGGNITVDGFTIRKGKSPSTGDGGGLYLISSTSESTHSGDLTVTNNIIVSNAAEKNGGGIYAKSQSNPNGTAGSVTISNNTITNNQVFGQPYASGGGVYAESYSSSGSSGDVIVTDNTVAGNTSTYAGGIWALSYGPVGPGNVTVTDNFVEGNTATGGNAGGIYANSHSVTADSGTVTISRNTLIDNSTSGGNDLGKGGGVYAETKCATSGNGGAVLLFENIISGNNARVGGGVYAETVSFTQTGGVVRLYNNTITGNTTERAAGGIWALTLTSSGTAGNIILANNIIAGNRTGDFFHGGGAWLRSWAFGTGGAAGTMTFTNNTVTANRAYVGDGFYVLLENNAARFYNNVIRDNRYPTGGDINISGTGTTSAYNNNYAYILFSWTNSGNNINLDPKFKNPGAWNDNSTPSNPFDDTWLGGDFHLRPDSPCIDAGMNGAPEIRTHDFEDDLRVVDGDGNGSALVDIGADEFIRQMNGSAALILLLLSP